MTDAPSTPAPAAPSPAQLADRLTSPSGSGEPDPPALENADDRAAEVKMLRRENASWRTKLREAEARLAELESQTQTEAEKALNAARTEAIKETTAKFHKRLLAAEVGRLAAELRFRDPGDAARLVDLEGVEVGPDGEIDGEAIRATLAAVAKAKPYLIDAEPPVPTARDVGLGVAGGGPSGDYERYSVTDFDKEFYG